MKATKIVAVLAVAGLALAACGGDDDDDDAASDTTAAAGATATTAAGSTDTTAAAAPGTTAAAGGTETTAAALDCPAKEPLETVSIGLVTDVGTVDDKSFNQSTWEGAQAAAEATGGTAEYIETAAAPTTPPTSARSSTAVPT